MVGYSPRRGGFHWRGGTRQGKEVLPEPLHLQCGTIQCDDVQDVDLFEYGETPLSPPGVDCTAVSEKEIETRAGKGIGRRR